jgi:hypothetical protein
LPAAAAAEQEMPEWVLAALTEVLAVAQVGILNI